ncbi:hypothetical protein HOY82DRAFT_610014 [Tuber indicum]|nr:hypothetical protein HOY82DRAFT_610014 [Tuber indicum]
MAAGYMTVIAQPHIATIGIKQDCLDLVTEIDQAVGQVWFLQRGYMHSRKKLTGKPTFMGDPFDGTICQVCKPSAFTDVLTAWERPMLGLGCGRLMADPYPG